MNQDYQLMDKQGIRDQDNSQSYQEFNTLNYFLFLILQLIVLTIHIQLCICWACLISYTGFGALLVDTTTSFTISYSIIGGFSLIALISMKVIKNIYNPNKFILGALFILSNTLFVAYSILGLILNYSSTIYYYQQPEANMWFIYITLGTLLLSFLIIPNRFRQFRWLSIILIPLIYSIIAKYTYHFYDMSFSIWIGIFGAICLLYSEQQKEDYEFFVALDSFGFVLLMVIKVVQYLWNSFFSTNTSSSVLQLQDLDKAKFITYTYLIACASFLLIPQMAYLMSETEIFCTFYFYRNPYQQKYVNYSYNINAGLWIFLGINYLLHLILFLTNRILTIGYKSIIAYLYLTIHIICVAGIYYTTSVMITCYFLDQVNNTYAYNHVNPYFKPFWFCYYLIIMVQQLMMLITAILVASNKYFCLNTLNHGLLILSLIVFGNSAFEIDFANQDFYFVILLIFVMNYLLIYLGQQFLKEDSYFLYFNDDEYLISGALLSEPVALYIYQSAYIHFRYIFAK